MIWSSCAIWRRACAASVALAVARARALLGQLRAGARCGGLAGRQREVGEPIAEVLEREGQAHGQLAGIGDGLGESANRRAIPRAGLSAPLVVQGQEAAGRVESRLLADAGQHVGQRARRTGAARRRLAGARRSGWLVATSGRRAARAGLALQPPALDRSMALDLDEAALAPKIATRRSRGARAVGSTAAGASTLAQRAVGAAGEADEPCACSARSRPGPGPLPFRGAHLHEGDQAAEILVALAVFHEQGQSGAVGQGQLAADERRDARARGGR